MSRVVPYLIFYSIVFFILFGLHCYVYARMKPLLNYSFNARGFLFVALVASFFPTCSVLEKLCTNTLIMVFYTAASIWLGILFLLFSGFVIYEPLRPFIKIDAKIATILITAAALMLSAYALVNGQLIRVKTLTIPLPNLKKPLRAVLLSDIHVGTIHNTGYVKRIVTIVNNLHPDVVFITGDLFDGIGPVNQHTVKPLRNIKGRVFFTIGNHELYEGVNRIAPVLEDTNVQMLRNEMILFQDIQIIGIDYPTKENQKDNLVISTFPIDKSKPSILLYHPPKGVEDAKKAGINLQLSGHTHRGQIFPFDLITGLFYHKLYGLYHTGNLTLYVTSGTGTWGPPMRLGSHNEITLLNLVPG